MTGAHDAGGVMHVHANVAVCRKLRLARMQPYAYPYGRTRWPDMTGNGALRRHRRRHGVRGPLESHEEPISRRIDLIPVPGLERLT